MGFLQKQISRWRFKCRHFTVEFLGSTPGKRVALCRGRGLSAVQSQQRALSQGEVRSQADSSGLPDFRTKGLRLHAAVSAIHWILLSPGGSVTLGWEKFPERALAVSCLILQSWKENLGGALIPGPGLQPFLSSGCRRWVFLYSTFFFLYQWQVVDVTVTFDPWNNGCRYYMFYTVIFFLLCLIYFHDSYGAYFWKSPYWIWLVGLCRMLWKHKSEGTCLQLGNWRNLPL